MFQACSIHLWKWDKKQQFFFLWSLNEKKKEKKHFLNMMTVDDHNVKSSNYVRYHHSNITDANLYV